MTQKYVKTPKEVPIEIDGSVKLLKPLYVTPPFIPTWENKFIDNIQKVISVIFFIIHIFIYKYIVCVSVFQHSAC